MSIETTPIPEALETVPDRREWAARARAERRERIATELAAGVVETYSVRLGDAMFVDVDGSPLVRGVCDLADALIDELDARLAADLEEAQT